MPLRQFWFVPLSRSRSRKLAPVCSDVGSLSAPCKPHFWLAGPILPSLGTCGPPAIAWGPSCARWEQFWESNLVAFHLGTPISRSR
jgi:hypothetical protein